jgi:hypothetical protein
MRVMSAPTPSEQLPPLLLRRLGRLRFGLRAARGGHGSR